MVGNAVPIITNKTEIYLRNPRLGMMDRLYKFDSFINEGTPAYIFIPENYDTMLVIFDE
jgi:hypothetical protein